MKSLIASLLLAIVITTPSMAGDLKDDLLAMEKKSWTAWGKRDGNAYLDYLTEDAVQAVAGAGVTSGRSEIISAVNANTCKMARFDFSDAKLRQLSPDIALISYVATQDTVCDGAKLPRKVYATSTYIRQSGKWRSAHYQETPLE